jgi:hypothetical protein
MPTKKSPWQYGVSPNPKNWHEAADALKSMKSMKQKRKGLMDRIDSIEKMLKDKK